MKRDAALVRLAALIALSPMPALAHPGHWDASGYLAGLIHPLTGIDHLLAMVAVGLLGGRIGGRAAWLTPLAFVVSMLCGAIVGVGATSTLASEAALAASVIALGVAVVAHHELRHSHVLALATFAGTLHGYAHGHAADAAVLSVYAVGLITSTTTLHAAGVFAALAMRHRPDKGAWMLKATGSACAGAGLLLFVGLLGQA